MPIKDQVYHHGYRAFVQPTLRGTLEQLCSFQTAAKVNKCQEGGEHIVNFVTRG